MENFKPVAQINEDDNNGKRVIQVGIMQYTDELGKNIYDIVASDGKHMEPHGVDSFENAMTHIQASWGRWKTFKWLGNQPS